MREELQSIDWLKLFDLEPDVGMTVIEDNGQIIHFNQAALKLFGVEDDGLANRNLNDVFSEEYVQERMTWVRDVLDNNRPLRATHIYCGRMLVSSFYPHRHEQRNFAIVLTRLDGILPDGDIKDTQSQYIDLGPLSVLSPRELEVLVLLGQGNSVPEVSRLLFRSPRTIERHKTEIGHKLGVSSIAQLTRLVAQAGLRPEHLPLQRFNAVPRPHNCTPDLLPVNSDAPSSPA
ncbi:PAS and helix-turn-helix domain-containing protein [Rhodopirellula sp. JC740]|uniref:PAS and helix-turn-helix domain-containing protein n=1 Tax=Rhodopirellula halodulae TaxID=2894198 RepID=A0ABS8ND32_9BACT|nr:MULTISPECIES: PAS and helix-turn-helix domain-containing protein [unclassified Rhodopirellula]MCC9641462.1 PAS and helix-turn-helix domain-containing protein [Rhodopirellula sp. JC740]MCC9657870.1 PAS and helix-turn-helix domain-containing protein [Rhodopirellula sp. JC737]